MTLQVQGLGKLVEVPDSPPGETFWAGAFDYHDGGAPQRSVFYLCVRGGHAPADAQLAFARRILAAIDGHIDGARRLLAEKLRADPRFFGVDGAAAARTLEKGEALLPFDQPEPTFHAPEAWQLRFAEVALPRCEALGVSVAFAGTTPVNVEDLSDSTPAPSP